jgi:exonuclease SbcD
MDHTTVSGCDFMGHDHITDYTVGGIDGITLEEFGTGYDYVALGHIHNPQNVKGSDGKVRYSGTPLPVTFDETYDHSVTLVEIAARGESPVLTEVPIDNIHPLVSLPAEGFATWDEAKELLEKFSSDMESYIRLNIEVEDFLPSDAEMTSESICYRLGHRFCYNNVRRKVVAADGVRTMTIEEFKEQSPLDFAEMYLADRGVVFDDEMKEMFKQAMEFANELKRNS